MVSIIKNTLEGLIGVLVFLFVLEGADLLPEAFSESGLNME